MSDDLFRRMEREVRPFGGELPIDDLLPELDARSDVILRGAPAAEAASAATEAAPSPAAPPAAAGEAGPSRSDRLQQEFEDFMGGGGGAAPPEPEGEPPAASPEPALEADDDEIGAFMSGSADPERD